MNKTGVVATNEVPFLSVVLPLREYNETLFRETLLSMTAQTCLDFELLVVLQTKDNAIQAAVLQTIEELPNRIEQKIFLIKARECGEPHQASPDTVAHGIREGLNRARGAYCSVLQVGEIVFADWVETLKQMATTAGKRMLMPAVVAQKWKLIQAGTYAGAPYAVAAPCPMEQKQAEEQGVFEPALGLAFPQKLCAEGNIAFSNRESGVGQGELLAVIAPRDAAEAVKSERAVGIHRIWQDSKEESQAQQNKKAKKKLWFQGNRALQGLLLGADCVLAKLFVVARAVVWKIKK